MLLAIDTATRWTGLAIHDGRAIVAELGWRDGGRQTVELAPAVADLLRRTGIEATDLAAVAVANGPGSYTGLRIGLGFAKGLAAANHVKLIGVPTLDIVAAEQPFTQEPLVVVIEAGRTRIWSGAYRWQAGKGWQSDGQPVNGDWPALLAGLEEPVVFAGEIAPGAAKAIKAANKAHQIVSAAGMVRRAGYLAELGWMRLRRGWTDDPRTLAPVYMRGPSGGQSTDA
ncbi:MAG: tRNA (adenosine(37)-N6)-threonylcarbamoyltransferase complex dimerization subunit type 1 TsaB [Candidatus Promineifilaceae bacterium]|jgi:tRNA threonylcarbamoyladenosine biosynthesis protein TsaB